MDDTLARALSAWNLAYLFPYQELVIRNLLDHDECRQAVILPTGAGKSLCFQLPAQVLPHPTLVVYPLRSLTADQKRRNGQAGLATAVLQGGQTRAQRHRVWDDLAAGRVRLLLSNPETLDGPEVRRRLARVPLSHAVIDEAHCFELWGRSFRPAYRRLTSVLADLAVPRLTAFTATATERIVADWVGGLFGGRPFSLIRASADRPNLAFAHEPYLSLRRSLPRTVLREARPCVVFCRSREQVRRWAQHLNRETALDVRFYHAGLSPDEKAGVEAWFQASDDGVLLATNAYGMGVDKKNIRTVLHLEAAPGPEDYLQEAGRAGRDGEPARALLLVRSRADTPGATCRRAALLAAFGEADVACSGCDVCGGLDQSPPADLGPALLRLAPLVRRADATECRAYLTGRWPPALWDCDLRRRAGEGLWADEDDLTAAELWRGLVDGGWVRFASRGLWKGLLEP